MNSLKSPLNLAVLAVAALAAIGLSYYYAPFYTFQQIRKAVLADDILTIQHNADFAAATNALIDQLQSAMAQSLKDSNTPNREGILASTAFATTNMANQFYSPHMLVPLLAQTHQPGKARLSDGLFPRLHGEYLNTTTFSIPLEYEMPSGPQEIQLIFTRRGAWTWQLIEIHFPPAMLANTNTPETCRPDATVVARPFFIPRTGLQYQDCIPHAVTSEQPAAGPLNPAALEKMAPNVRRFFQNRTSANIHTPFVIPNQPR